MSGLAQRIKELKRQLQDAKRTGDRDFAEELRQEISDLELQQEGEETAEDLKSKGKVKAYTITPSSVKAMYQAVTSDTTTDYVDVQADSIEALFPGVISNSEDTEAIESENEKSAVSKELAASVNAKETILKCANRLAKGKITAEKDGDVDMIKFHTDVSALTFLVELGKYKLQFLTKKPSQVVKHGLDLVIMSELPTGEKFSMQVDKRGFLDLVAVS